MQCRRCFNHPRSAAGGDPARRVADYVAGYAEATADRHEDADGDIPLPRD
ncbi:hypothetical protein [Mycobacterium sp.]|nr:hypothetical protein [Mycobacterium sp.]